MDQEVWPTYIIAGPQPHKKTMLSLVVSLGDATQNDKAQEVDNCMSSLIFPEEVDVTEVSCRGHQRQRKAERPPSLGS